MTVSFRSSDNETSTKDGFGGGDDPEDTIGDSGGKNTSDDSEIGVDVVSTCRIGGCREDWKSCSSSLN